MDLVVAAYILWILDFFGPRTPPALRQPFLPTFPRDAVRLCLSIFGGIILAVAVAALMMGQHH